MRNIGLYSPYIPDHFGGGERYLLSIAQTLGNNDRVWLCVDHKDVPAAEQALHTYEKVFGLDLSKVSIAPISIGKRMSALRLWHETRAYDVFFAITDGSVFASGAKKSYFISQLPWTFHPSLAFQFKLSFFWNEIIVYSEFVRSVLAKSWGSFPYRVLSPYVDSQEFAFHAHKKEKIILSVGRFFSHARSNSKRQDVLIDAFRALVDTGRAKGWILVLAGSVEDPKYLRELEKMADGYSVIFAKNISYDELRSYYARASLYWHAAGFGVDEQRHPENTEHFGITTLEAIASGCIPLVVPKGGQREVVADEWYHWFSQDDLVKKSLEYMSFSSGEIVSRQKRLLSQIQRFEKVQFEKNIRELV